MSSKPQLLYGAYDTGPSNYGLYIIDEAQRKRNWGITYWGNNPEYNYYLASIAFDYAIIGGPSSFQNGLDRLILSYGRKRCESVYVLGDSPRSILRPGVKGYVDRAVAICAVSSDISFAKEFGYQDAVWLGYPSHWDIDPAKVIPSDIVTNGTYPEAAVRVLVVGCKHAEITDTMLVSVISGMDQRVRDWRIYFQAHPSEIDKTKNTDRRTRLLAHPLVSEIKTRESVASMMMAVHVTVCTGGATAILEGALLRLPVIYYLDFQVMDYMKEQANEQICGSVRVGACEQAFPDMMPFLLNKYLDASASGDRARLFLHGQQKNAFPIQPAELNVAHEVLEYIQNPRGYVPFGERQNKKNSK